MLLTACNIRKSILGIANKCSRSVHLGGSLSIVEILTVLYRDVLRYKIDIPQWEERDRFILSKGHCVLALYAVLKELGVLTDEEVSSIMQDGSEFGAHPVMNSAHMIECSSGSLGQGIGFAVGVALAAKLQNKNYKSYVLLGNGECNEGAVFEALFFAVQKRLDNLTVIIDNNSLQSDGRSKDIVDLSKIPNMLSDIGFDVDVIDGHNEKEILTSLSKSVTEKPKAIVANTIKGKGVSFMENNNEWHHNRLINEYYELAMAEQAL